jgi:hypothetical protein
MLEAAVSPDCGSALPCDAVVEDPLTQVSQGGWVVEEVAELEAGGCEAGEVELAAPPWLPMLLLDDALLEGGVAPPTPLPTVRLLTIVAPGAADFAISSARCLSWSVATVPFSVI